MDSLQADLDAAQAAAVTVDNASIISFGTYRFKVDRSGARLGQGPKAPWMRWRLQSEFGFVVLMSPVAEPIGHQPNVWVRVTSVTMMSLGLSLVWNLIKGMIRAMGGAVMHNKVSRVDPCVDLASVPVASFMELRDRDWFVTRAKRRARHEVVVPAADYGQARMATGFAVGKRPTALRVYDKLLESRHDPVKRQVLLDRRWGFLPDAATRIEFELGRQKLKAFGIETVEDWFRHRGVICRRLCESWFRLTAGPVDRNHAGRTPTHPLWRLVADRFAEWCGPLSMNETASVEPIGPVSLDQLVKQLVGVGLTAMAIRRTPAHGPDDFLGELVDLMAPIVGRMDIPTEIQKRRIKRGIGALDGRVEDSGG